ncbi:hypothetical protein, partial [Mesorhizobium sp. M2A.F.Ca.ET.017.03.2.1]|uniref:hypothetical protein n=1 Tax=Mesorhizobium sp. M2A.F.Ca.ET.017.03.2.1 TaxID=2496650 RepID=UPI001AECB1D9
MPAFFVVWILEQLSSPRSRGEVPGRAMRGSADISELPILTSLEKMAPPLIWLPPSSPRERGEDGGSQM